MSAKRYLPVEKRNTPRAVVTAGGGKTNLKLGADMPSQICTFPHRTRPEAVLAVNLSRDDHSALSAMFTALPLRLIHAETSVQGLRQAMSQPVRVVVCERDLPDGNWKHLFDKVGELAHPPRFIVASRLADERLWAEVLNLGGYDVLATPFDADEVHRVMSYAVDSWHCQVDAGAKYAPAPGLPSRRRQREAARRSQAS
jgi:DNA-binding NtrC family response regulator